VTRLFSPGMRLSCLATHSSVVLAPPPPPSLISHPFHAALCLQSSLLRPPARPPVSLALFAPQQEIRSFEKWNLPALSESSAPLHADEGDFTRRFLENSLPKGSAIMRPKTSLKLEQGKSIFITLPFEFNVI